jgi:toxin ParE1/3/4
MKYKIYKTAREQIIKIWRYTEEKWGEKQANKYIRELYESLREKSLEPQLWRIVNYKNITGVFYYKYKKHFVFFRKLSNDSVGVINILHERVSIPERLLEDLNEH